MVALFRPYRWQLSVVVALIVASSAVALATPFLIRLVIDDAIPEQDIALLLWAVGGMLAVTVVTAVFGVVQTWLSTTVGQRVMHGLRTAVFTHLQRQSLGFFTRTRGGEVQSRLTNDIGGMQSVVTSTATSFASSLTTVIGTAVAMAVLSWRLSLLSLIVLPPAILLTRRVARMRRTITAQRQRSWPTCTRRSRRGSRSAACCSARPSAPGRHSRSGSPSPPTASSRWRSAPSWPGAGGWRR
ncbi:ABC transporter transmembrane domain-containing protein [Blastococcus brunescens]|uniref:ABC transporter transmembrane domain-containing protein n=1 Tax=Blastococcus brunescens TaxID=1564165 RepID=A0ABZ1B198_9ACTN|nr:ABC transporter transmembrane domain-containing protein [Blastococcus sp. BMG 8361]WRL63951.1 ABC transporter transmembrane domain-containing protein [Blastococcus sp. BMG 8361]